MQSINILGGYGEYKHTLVWRGKHNEENKLTPREAKLILKSTKSWMLRNIYDWDSDEPTNFWAVINDTHREISELPSKVRNQVRRCLKDCEIKIISKEELVTFNGYEVFKSSFKRYRDVTVKIPSRNEWEKSIYNKKKFEFWGVFQKASGILIAYSMISHIGNIVNYNTLKAIPELMNKHYPYFGLLYEMNRKYLLEDKAEYVFDGFRSITEHSNIQPFLEKNFLFRKAYCKVKIYYKPWLGFIISLLYPFKKIIPFTIIKHILNFEAIHREC